MANKAEVQRQLEDRMREFKAQIDHLNHKIEQSGEQARKELERSLDEVKARNERAEQQLKELRDANEAVWETVANDIETYWSAFTGAVNEVFLDTDETKKSTVGSTVRRVPITNLPDDNPQTPPSTDES